MSHSRLEPGLFRHWRDGWYFEVAWGGGFRWFGVKYTQSRDREDGRMFAMGFWWLLAYVAFEHDSTIERCVGLWFDDQHLCAQAYRGDDEKNSPPWMWEWPWQRWHHDDDEHVVGGKVSYPYRYELQSGEVQEVIATVNEEFRRWRWLHPANPFFSIRRRYLAVEFSEEVGEQRGTWKGGVLGCAIEMRPGEDKVAALRRMERKRRFT